MIRPIISDVNSSSCLFGSLFFSLSDFPSVDVDIVPARVVGETVEADDDPAWLFEGVEDVDVIIEFVNGIVEDSGFVNNAEEMVLLETSVGVTDISCFSVALVTSSVADDCVVVDCVPLELAWSDCVVCIGVDTVVVVSFVVGIVVVVVVVGLEWELTPSELIGTVEEGVDIEDVDFSIDAFTGKLVVVIGEVSDVPVMLQSEKNHVDGDEFWDET